MADKHTAVELLKTFGVSRPDLINNLPRVMRRFIEDKAYDFGVVKKLSSVGSFGRMFQFFVLKAAADVRTEALWNYFGSTAGGLRSTASAVSFQTEQYYGLPRQNAVIDRALANSGHQIINAGGIHTQGEGACTNYHPSYTHPASLALGVPIAIIGYGAAGILMARALRIVGFSDVSVYEKSHDVLGIWSQRNVYAGTKNNPRRLSFVDIHLEPAPGAGIDVRAFLSKLVYTDGIVKTDALVTAIRPRNFEHTVVTGKIEKTYPIVVNTIGLGSPRPINDVKRMTTLVSPTNAGIRWQQILTPAQMRGRHIVLIGLGNSTAEMLSQIHSAQDEGVDVDYSILTHYPKEAVRNPRAVVYDRGVNYQVFRDLSTLNLTDYQGDLLPSLRDYNRALHNNRIFAGCKSWTIDKSGPGMRAYDEKNKLIFGTPSAYLFTLIGYQHCQRALESFGCTYDVENECAAYDYDGEFIENQDSTGAARMYKGYFGLGSVLDAPHNRNAVVIPGMFHRMYDLMFSIIMRAEEYVSRKS